MSKTADGVRKAAARVIREAPETQQLLDDYRIALRTAHQLRAQLDFLAKLGFGFDALSGALPASVLGYGNSLKYRSDTWACDWGRQYEELTAPGVARWQDAFDALLTDAAAKLPDE